LYATATQNVVMLSKRGPTQKNRFCNCAMWFICN